MLKKIDKILIANRGEIACRIIKTAHKMGIKCVAIYSDADERALHVERADEARYVGPSPSSQSYLNIEKICQVAVEAKVDAVHPGYGFLSENPDFSESLKKYGIRFIGPSTATIRLMADKVTSKKVAIDAGVNTVPGYAGTIANAKEAQEIANQIGFPVMIKATAGGGGKGMRIVRSAEEIESAFISATNEAVKSFKDGRIFIEKYIESPRHIEIQILADQYGNIVCLGERECSIQRHNQKVIEETPSPFLDDITRKKMYEQCINLAKKVNYYSAGTIEFIMDQNKQFYFLEMNTRLQVEHPVTELMTGIDIVEAMINIANGDKLKITQDDIKINSSAIEARVYAEDPEKNFFPSSGRVTVYSEPLRTSNLRIDTGVYEGAEISMFYDPMIAKICTHGSTRNEAIKAMQNALNEFHIAGIVNNLDFLSSIFHNSDFIAGDINTGFIAQHYPSGFVGDTITEEGLKVFLVTAMFVYLQQERVSDTHGDEVYSIFVNDQEYLLHAKYVNDKLTAIYNHEVFTVEVSWSAQYQLITAKINGEIYNIKFARQQHKYLLRYSAMRAICMVCKPHVAKLAHIMPKETKKQTLSHIESPISGMIVKINVKAGDIIQVGQPLFTIEAMKMENVIYSEVQATIKEVLVHEGSSVQVGEVVIKL